MFVGAALMFLALGGPSPLAPDADGEAILGEINAGDPAITKPPAPLERLVAAAELAEEKLRAADEPDAMFDMLTLSAAARKVAYGRTGEAVHLCRLVAAAERVLGRGKLPAGLLAAAEDFRDEARAELGERVCEEKREEVDPLLPIVRGAVGTVRPVVVMPVVERPRGTVIAGAVLLGTAAVTAAALIPVQVRRVQAFRELEGLVDAIEAAGSKTPEQAQRLEELYAVHGRTAAAKIGLGVSAGVLAAVGVWLVAAGKVRRSSSRARVEPFGGPFGAGVVVSGRF